MKSDGAMEETSNSDDGDTIRMRERNGKRASTYDSVDSREQGRERRWLGACIFIAGKKEIDRKKDESPEE